MPAMQCHADAAQGRGVIVANAGRAQGVNAVVRVFHFVTSKGFKAVCIT